MRKCLCLLLPLLLLGASATAPISPVLRLQSHPSTGAGWSIELDDATLLDVLDETDASMATDAPADETVPTDENAPTIDVVNVERVGGVTTSVYRLAGKAPGSGTLTMVYGRPWETDEEKYVLIYHFTVDEGLNVVITGQEYQTR